MAIKILLADDHKIVRDGIKHLLEKNSNFEVIGEAENGRETINLARRIIPDVVIMDISMPGLNGVEATRQLHTELPDTKVIALSMYSDKRYVKGMLKAGASGYLIKDCDFEELSDAIRTVIRGNIYLGIGITDTVVKDYVDRSSEGETSEDILTDREREIAQSIAEGKSTKEIAAILNISIKTVETHRKNIYDKLEIGSVAELVKFAIREGIISLNE